jgi:hypothetical protein
MEGMEMKQLKISLKTIMQQILAKWMTHLIKV